MKILYYLNEEIKEESGVVKKIKAQIKSLSRLNNSVNLAYDVKEKKKIIKMIDGRKIGEYRKNKIGRIQMYYDLIKHLAKIKYDLIYIRYTGYGDWYFFNFLRMLYKLEIKIVVEIPTYPYDLENKNMTLKGRYKGRIEKILREFYKKYIYKIVTYSKDEKIWKIPCINISNGVDLEEIKLVEKIKRDEIAFISVSSCSFWHGIDRFLYSILEYKKNGGEEKIKFHIVGEGMEIPKLKKIVEDNIGLQDVVIFHGFKSGEELDKIYNNSDIALGSIGRFRSGLTIMKSLKNREYGAKGLPMIYSEIDLDFENKDFVYKVSHDEHLINIEEIITWYKNLKISSEEIREYSKKFSWESQMKKVFDEVKEL